MKRSTKLVPKRKKRITTPTSVRAAFIDPASQVRERVADSILVARDAMTNLQEFLEIRNRMAFLAIRECEEELDKTERKLDDEIPTAMVRVNERTARELIACLRFITDLERIGDLTLWAARHFDETRPTVSVSDLDKLRKMTFLLAKMLRSVHEAFEAEDADAAREIMARDQELDEIRHNLYAQHLTPGLKNGKGGLEVVFISQALERAGDHITNLAEELIHLAEEKSIRHSTRRVRDE